MNDRLPIYRLASEGTDIARLNDIGQRIFGLKQDFELRQHPTGCGLHCGRHVVELAAASGGIWAADEDRLWNPAQDPKLPTEKDALARANQIVAERELLPRLKGPFKFGKPIVGGTHFATNRNRDRKRENRRLDVQIAYPVQVGDLPVVGGGGDFTIVLGDRADVIGFSGGWRPAELAFDAKVIDPKRADEQFREMTKGMKIKSFDRSLAYYAAPSFRALEFLYPVYVYRATALFDDRKVPLRLITLPATEFGPPIKFGEPQPPRRKAPRARRPEKRESRRSYATFSLWNPFEAGTSWIGLSGGLAGSQANAQGFVDEWAAAGWQINFNWGDANAWESDWRRNDDTWVDAADFVFYTGHANMDGWVLSNPDDGFLSFTEVGSKPRKPGDLWGQNDLEWAVIAACGPLQDALLASGGGDVFDRWDGAFDGLHILMGYGAITFDNTDEGRKIAQYAKGGSSLINAWFRTAKEIQPSTNGASAPDGPTVYVGAMWVGRDGIDPGSDRAWGFGSVSADPINPNWYAAMWTMC
jgi:hypothetical protein